MILTENFFLDVKSVNEIKLETMLFVTIVPANIIQM